MGRGAEVLKEMGLLRNPQTQERSPPPAAHVETPAHAQHRGHAKVTREQPRPSGFQGNGYQVGNDEADLQAALAASLADEQRKPTVEDEAAPSDKEVFTRFVHEAGVYAERADEIWATVRGNPHAAVEMYLELVAVSHTPASSGWVDEDANFEAAVKESRMQGNPTTRWHCLECTFYNGAGRSTCEMCDAKKVNDPKERLKRLLKDKGHALVEQPGDGNCLYHTIAHKLKQVSGEDVYTAENVRHEIATWVIMNGNKKMDDDGKVSFAVASGETNWGQYCLDMFKDRKWGGEPELIAASQIYKVRWIVVSDSQGTRHIEAPEQWGTTMEHEEVIAHTHEKHYDSTKKL